MAAQFVADKKVIINLQGIRYVQKAELSTHHYGMTEDNRYQIQVTYKGNILNVGYASIAERDKTYDELVAALVKAKNERE